MTGPRPAAGGTFVLSPSECLTLLASRDIGRIAVVHDGYPLIFPVNYRLAQVDGQPVIAIRTRIGNPIDHPDELVGFQIDGVDAGHDGGWSVLVRGRLVPVAPNDRLDSHPLVADDRDAWRIIIPSVITGRHIVADPLHWPFHPAGYV